MFLYIGLADLLPELHGVNSGKSLRRELFAFFLGIVLAYLSIVLIGGEAH